MQHHASFHPAAWNFSLLDTIDWEAHYRRHHDEDAGDEDRLAFEDRVWNEQGLLPEGYIFRQKHIYYALSLATYWLRLRHIWFANNAMKAKWGPEVVPMDHPFGNKLMAVLCHLYRCNLKEQCQFEECYGTYRVIKQLVNCKSRKECLMCSPLEHEDLLIEELKGLVRENKREDEEWTDNHYLWAHYHSMTYNRLIWRWLIRDILHSYHCKGRCKKPSCKVFTRELKHIKRCPSVNGCRESQKCGVFRRSIHHWNSCSNVHCTVCAPCSNANCTCCVRLRRGKAKETLILDTWK